MSVVSDYAELREFLKNEFNFDDREDVHEKVLSIIGYFSEAGFVTQSVSGGYKLTKRGFGKMPIWAALAKTFIESYWIAAMAMGIGRKKAGTGDALLKRISYMGKRYHKLGTIEHIESLSQINFKNAVTLINKKILKTADGSGDDRHDFEEISQFTKRLYNFSHYG